MMKLHVLINTYNRPEQLNELLTSIKFAKPAGCELDISVFNDGSTEKYDMGYIRKNNGNAKFYIFKENHGKKRYWELINYGLSQLKKDYDYYFMLPDDDTVSSDFFTKAIEIWEAITDKNKICLSVNLLKDRLNKSCWTGVMPVLKTFDKAEVYLTQWNDLCFMSTRKFFETLDWLINPISESRWDGNPNLSSGVGEQISIRLLNKGWNMYHVSSSLVFTKYSTQSVMNLDERVKTPIIQVK